MVEKKIVIIYLGLIYCWTVLNQLHVQCIDLIFLDYIVITKQ